eukprot:11951-Heterococcus_DN1.PRE.2
MAIAAARQRCSSSVALRRSSTNVDCELLQATAFRVNTADLTYRTLHQHTYLQQLKHIDAHLDDCAVNCSGSSSAATLVLVAVAMTVTAVVAAARMRKCRVLCDANSRSKLFQLTDGYKPDSSALSVREADFQSWQAQYSYNLVMGSPSSSTHVLIDHGYCMTFLNVI